MTSKLKILLLLLALSVLAQPIQQIRPIYITTLTLDNRILHLNTCIFKTIEIPLTKEAFEAQSNINVIATISQIQSDQNFAFQFGYQIKCPSSCYIDFALTRFTQNITSSFQYKLAIDFLVAQNIIFQQVNMTISKTDFTFAKSKPQLAKEGTSTQGRDWSIVLIPNGFNKVSLTGYISSEIMPESDRIVLSYNSSLVKWGLNENYIIFKVLFIPLDDPQRDKSESCLENNLKGFLSTKKSIINANVHGESDGSEGQYELASIAVSCQLFTDERVYEYAELQAQSSHNPLISIYFVVPLLIAEIAYILYKKNKHRSSTQQPVHLPDMLISFQSTQIGSTASKEAIPMQLESEQPIEQVQ